MHSIWLAMLLILVQELWFLHLVHHTARTVQCRKIDALTKREQQFPNEKDEKFKISIERSILPE